jgi:hypothetical protein
MWVVTELVFKGFFFKNKIPLLSYCSRFGAHVCLEASICGQSLNVLDQNERLLNPVKKANEFYEGLRKK